MGFAIFAMKLTSDNRYVMSRSNKFITFDVVTSDLARQVYPKVEGLMIGLELSQDNKFAAAYTNNNTTILLNTLIGEFFIIKNPLGNEETVQGLVLLDTNLIIYGQQTWKIFDLKGNLVRKEGHDMKGQIVTIKMVETLDNYSIITWSGDVEEPNMYLQTYKEKIPCNPLEGHSSMIMTQKQTRAFICENQDNFTVTSLKYENGYWAKEREFEENLNPILMLELSKNEKWCYAATQKGFKLWNVEDDRFVELRLPSGVRNISKNFNQSNNIVLSKGDLLAVSGIRQELNVWNLDYIFEKEQHIDKHELTIDTVSISTSAQIAVVVTRSCIGIWDFMTGKLKFKLANSALGAIITHALVNEEGTHIVSAESGDVLYWDLESRKVIFQQKQDDIQQIFFYKNQTRCIVVSKKGTKGNLCGLVISRSIPGGEKQWEFEFPFTTFIKVVMTSDEHHLVCYDADKVKSHLYIHTMKTGNLVSKVVVKYNGFKEVTKLIALPDKPSVVALIDVDKGNVMDIIQRRFIKSIPCWDGTCSKDGRYGLYAPATGGMEMLDLRTGKVCKTLIPKVAEGIFDVMAVFNETNEYVLYYHSGRKTIRAFRRKDGKMIANFRVQADLKGMETTTDGRSVVLGMGDGSMTTLTIADPEKEGIADFLKSLPSRNPEAARGSKMSRTNRIYQQNGVEYPSPYDYSIYTDYLKALQQCIPPAPSSLGS